MDIVSDFDTEKFYLGSLCKRGHDWNGTGRSLRYKRKVCLECSKLERRNRHQQNYKKKPKRATSLDRFLEILQNTNFGNECVEWDGCFQKGYGVVFKDSKRFSTHRLALEFKLQTPIPDDMGACHTCDHPKCFNPNHLYLGTQKQNIADAIARNRINRRKGENHSSAKLTEEKVKQIRYFKSQGLTHKEIAEITGTNILSISGIVNRRTWKHVP